MEHPIFKELKAQLGPLVEEHKDLTDSVHLFAWLRRNKYNVEATAKDIQQSYKWREEKGLNHPEHVEPPAGFRLSLDEVTADGVGVVFIDYSGVDVLGELSKRGAGHHLKLLMSYYMRLEKMAADTNRKRLESLRDLEDWKVQYKPLMAIINMKGIGLAQVTSVQCIKLAVDGLTIVMKYLPDIGDQLIIVKANTMFRIMYKILEPLVRGKYKIEVHQVGKDDWIEKISHRVRINQIPQSFGGTKFVQDQLEIWEAENRSRH